MLASEVIKRLHELIEEHGDLMVIYDHDLMIRNISFDYLEYDINEECFLIS